MDDSAMSVRADHEATERLIEKLRARVGPQVYNAWFKHGASIALQDGHVRVAVPNPFVANWIETRYHRDVEAASAEATGKALPVVVTVDASLSGTLRQRDLDVQAELVCRAAQGRSRRRLPANSLRHRLKDFVVGETNRLAHSAATAVAGGSRVPFNPLFIHGPCGVGKTHLLQGICNVAARRQHDGQPIRWRYVAAEQFTNEFLCGLRRRALADFRSRYRALDLLAIDDVHFLAAKKATQDEFLHTFNTIDAAGKQIVMASDAHPHLVGDLNEQLVSRFCAGMVVQIETPDQPTRLEILRRKAAGLNLQVPADVLEYVAKHVRGSVRELEGALIKLSALAALERGTVDLAIARAALADHLARTDGVLTLGDIEAAAAAFFGITPADLHSSRRTKTVSAARMVAMFLARRHTHMSYPEIGRFMGKNHSSVVLAVQRMEALLANAGEVSWMTPAGGRSIPAEQIVALLSDQFR